MTLVDFRSVSAPSRLNRPKLTDTGAFKVLLEHRGHPLNLDALGVQLDVFGVPRHAQVVGDAYPRSPRIGRKSKFRSSHNIEYFTYREPLYEGVKRFYIRAPSYEGVVQKEFVCKNPGAGEVQKCLLVAYLALDWAPFSLRKRSTFSV